jgi:hypothetical protein
MDKALAIKFLYKYELHYLVVPSDEEGMLIMQHDRPGLDVVDLPKYLYWDMVKSEQRN